jgi:hypothetical protein
MNLQSEFTRVTKAFGKQKIRYAVVGGLAMAFHDEPRFTMDIDLLVHSEDQGKMTQAMTKLGYFESAKPWRFTKVPITLRRFARTEGEEFISVDILVGLKRKIDLMVENAGHELWSKGTVPVARREDIIVLKRGRGSDQDKVDIKRLRK